MNIDTIIQVIATIVGVIALIFIYFQLRKQTKQLKFETLTEIHKEVFSKDFHKALGLIFNGDISSQRKEIEESIRWVSGVYDLLGVRVKEGALPRKATLKTEWKVLVYLLPRIKGYIEQIEKDRGLPYKEYFIWLAGKAQKHIEKYCPDCKQKLSGIVDYLEECKKYDSIANENGISRSKLKYKGIHLHYYEGERGWEFVHRANATGGVNIVAVTPENQILLVEQYRIPLQKNVIELPAGLVGDKTGEENEDAEDAVKRELKEETGYTCKEVKFLCKGPALPGLSDEINAFYIAKGLTKIDGEKKSVYQEKADFEEEIMGNIEEGEKIIVHKVPLNNLMSWLEDKTNEKKEVDLKVYAALFFLNDLYQEKNNTKG